MCLHHCASMCEFSFIYLCTHMHVHTHNLAFFPSESFSRSLSCSFFLALSLSLSLSVALSHSLSISFTRSRSLSFSPENDMYDFYPSIHTGKNQTSFHSSGKIHLQPCCSTCVRMCACGKVRVWLCICLWLLCVCACVRQCACAGGCVRVVERVCGQMRMVFQCTLGCVYNRQWLLSSPEGAWCDSMLWRTASLLPACPMAASRRAFMHTQTHMPDQTRPKQEAK